MYTNFKPLLQTSLLTPFQGLDRISGLDDLVGGPIFSLQAATLTSTFRMPHHKRFQPLWRAMDPNSIDSYSYGPSGDYRGHDPVPPQRDSERERPKTPKRDDSDTINDGSYKREWNPTRPGSFG